MKTCWLVCKIVLINLFFCHSCMAKSIFEPIWSYFSKPSYEHISLKELKLPKGATIILKNGSGNITIKEWNQDTVQLKATKQAFKEELLAQTTVDTQLHENTLAITTQHKTTDNTTLVQYELIVPQNTKVNITTDQGSITIDKLNAPIKAVTQDGTITINDTKAAVDALTENGAIIIKNVLGNVRAETNNGNITIYGAQHTVVAKTKTGTITTECSTVPSLDTILLNAQSGDIHLALPHKTNADLQARTAHGTLTCEHYVTIKPQTVQLNKKTWSRLKKEVAGTLGTGEATIKLHADAGNIKITQVTA